MIKLLIVDDSEIIVEAIKVMVSMDSEIQVVGTAGDGEQAIQMTKLLKPDIITMDLQMPKMGGMKAIEHIMAYQPTPILVISADYSEQNVFSAIEKGALDVISKPTNFNDPHYATNFCRNLKLMADVRVVRHIGGLKTQKKRSEPEMKVFGIVASTGGPKALKMILSGLEKERNCCIMIVQHMEQGFTNGLVRWLDTTITNCHVSIVEKTRLLIPGSVLVAPDNYHMVVGVDGKVHLLDDIAYEGHKPSGSLLLESIGQRYKENSVGVILTGMGTDGISGLSKIRKNNGKIICQDESTSMVFGMPKEAMRSGKIDYVLPVDQIANKIMELDREN